MYCVLCRASHDAEQEQEALVLLGAQLAALVEAFERVVRDEQAMESAAESFGSLLQARGGAVGGRRGVGICHDCNALMSHSSACLQVESLHAAD